MFLQMLAHIGFFLPFALFDSIVGAARQIPAWAVLGCIAIIIQQDVSVLWVELYIGLYHYSGGSRKWEKARSIIIILFTHKQDKIVFIILLKSLCES